MRRTIWISVAVHGALIAIAGSRDIERGVLAGMTRPIEIEIVSGAAPAPPVAASAPPAAARAPSAAAPVPTAEPAAPATATRRGAPARATAAAIEPGAGERPGSPGAGEQPGASTNALAMRGLRHDLALSGEAAARALGSGSRPTEPAVEPRWAHDPTIKLSNEPGGRKSVRDPVATVRVARDGTVDIEHAPELEVRLGLPTPDMLAREWRYFKKDFNRWLADPYRDTRVGKSQDLPNHLLAVQGACDSYGSFGCFTEADQRKQWEREDEGLVDGILGGKANFGDYLHRKLVGDPYASRKLKILDQTREERVRIGAEYRAEQLDRASELVRRNLERAWAATSDPAARRAALFAIWDECDEGEDERGAAGNRARAMVIGFIRAHLPEGSAEQFTAAEIEKLDAGRSSRQHFVPYAR